MSTVSVYSYTHSVTYVADNILKSMKDIIRLSGLDPSNLVGQWETLLRGIKHWIESKDLQSVKLEVYDPSTDKLITRWDIDVAYTWDVDAGTFWTDTDQLRYEIKKRGLLPSQAKYSVLLTTKPGSPELDGFRTVAARSTAGMVRQSLGTTIEHNGLGANTSYWRKQ